jgi:hypothetical protein
MDWCEPNTVRIVHIPCTQPPSPRHFPQVGEPAHGNSFPILGGEIRSFWSFPPRIGGLSIAHKYVEVLRGLALEGQL